MSGRHWNVQNISSGFNYVLQHPTWRLTSIRTMPGRFQFISKITGVALVRWESHSSRCAGLNLFYQHPSLPHFMGISSSKMFVLQVISFLNVGGKVNPYSQKSHQGYLMVCSIQWGIQRRKTFSVYGESHPSNSSSQGPELKTFPN